MSSEVRKHQISIYYHEMCESVVISTVQPVGVRCRRQEFEIILSISRTKKLIGTILNLKRKTSDERGTQSRIVFLVQICGELASVHMNRLQVKNNYVKRIPYIFLFATLFIISRRNDARVFLCISYSLHLPSLPSDILKRYETIVSVSEGIPLNKQLQCFILFIFIVV